MTTTSIEESPKVFVRLIGEFEKEQFAKLSQVFADLEKEGVEEVIFLIDCSGGLIDEAFELYKLLKKSKLKIHTHNEFSTHSCAHIFYQAGSQRTASPDAHFMAHGVQHNKRDLSEVLADLKVSPTQELKEISELLVRDQMRYDDHLRTHTKMPESQIEKFHAPETPSSYFNPTDAIAWGVADRIEEIVPREIDRLFEVKGTIHFPRVRT